MTIFGILRGTTAQFQIFGPQDPSCMGIVIFRGVGYHCTRLEWFYLTRETIFNIQHVYSVTVKHTHKRIQRKWCVIVLLL